MSVDQARKIEAYLSEWIRRVDTIRESAVEVQRMRDAAMWRVRGTEILDRHAPQEVTGPIEHALTREYETLTQDLPLPPDYHTLRVSASSTATSSTAAVVFGALRDLLKSPGQSPEMEAAIFDYLELQRKRDRTVEARSSLAVHFPSLVTMFDLAEKAFMDAKLNESDVTKAATEMRTLLDQVKGELREKARRNPNENMTWWLMAERLTTGFNFAMRPVLLEQETHRVRLVDDLSNILKRRKPADAPTLALAWVELTDHICITCGCL